MKQKNQSLIKEWIQLEEHKRLISVPDGFTVIKGKAQEGDKFFEVYGRSVEWKDVTPEMYGKDFIFCGYGILVRKKDRSK